jgi:DNA segregation ATPase FtsK/SpoIIIE, S-DNA-T family
LPRGRKKKKKPITVKSNETKIVFGFVLILLGIAAITAPFTDATLLEYIKQYLGYASIIWGMILIFLAVRLIWNPKFTSSSQILIGLILLALTSNTFFSFWLPENYAYSTEYLPGGLLGAALHFKLLETLSRPLEFVLLIILYVIGISLCTGVKLEQITSVVSNFFSSDEDEENEDESKLTIEGYDDEETREEDIVEPIDTNQEEYIENGEVIVPAKEEVEERPEKPSFTNWNFPPLQLLQTPLKQKQDRKIHERNAAIIEKTLESFGVHSKVTNISIGPTVVQYALSITVGTKVAKVKTLTNDLALALAAPSSAVRIEAPIPGTSLIGIEIPNPTPNFVYTKEMASELLNSEKNYELPLLLGKNVSGKTEIRDLVDLPHVLVAGATGTGKSVGINSILLGLLMTKSPDELKLILVDPKMVEMSLYNDIPHLYTPVIVDMELVSNALQWASQEMNRRYRILKQCKVKKITEYHEREGASAMPYIVIVIDEMADLMLTTGVDVESKIVRLAQMSRAVGIHLIIATQRPSVNVITGLIKANVPGRMAFSVTTSIDSRVIIDQMGAETLIGLGDMLFKSPASPRPIRIQGTFTETKDIENVIDFIKKQAKDEPEYLDDITKPKEGPQGGGAQGNLGSFSNDSLFKEALGIVVSHQKGSASLLQRKLRIGYNRAASLIDDLEKAKVLGPPEGSSPRKVLITDTRQILGEDENDEDLQY